MKRKLRIFSNIAIICLSVCMFAFGVYAASTVSVTTSGTVTFNATGVYATVSRTISGSSADASHNTLAPVKVTSDAQDNDTFAMDADLVFASANSPIVMSFTIKNEATDRDLYFKVTDNGSTLQENDNVRKIAWDLDYWVALAPEDEYTVEIQLSVVNANISVANCRYAYSFTLKSSLAGEGYYTLTKDDVTFASGTMSEMKSSVETKEKIVVPSSINGVEVTALSSMVFVIDASSLTDVVIPSSVTKLSGSFDGSTSIKKLFAPNVTEVEGTVIRNEFTEEVYLPKLINENYVIDGVNSTIKRAILPSATTYSSYWGTSFPSKLEVMVIPKITSLTGGADGEARSLKYLDISSLTVLPDSFLEGCTTIEVLLLNPNITVYGSEAFKDCYTMVFTKLPNTLEIIGGYAFDGLNSSNLKFNEIPSSVKTIGEYAFDDWSDLKSITIHNTIETIGAGAFGTYDDGEDTNKITINFAGTEADWNAKFGKENGINAQAFPKGSKVICTDSNGDPIIIP